VAVIALALSVLVMAQAVQSVLPAVVHVRRLIKIGISVISRAPMNWKVSNFFRLLEQLKILRSILSQALLNDLLRLGIGY
jgi:hypothetical protein